MLHCRRKLLACLFSLLLGAFLVAVYAGIRLVNYPTGFSHRHNEYGQALLLAELQALANSANVTLEQFAKAFISQQNSVRDSFCTNESSLPRDLCEGICKPPKQRVLLVFPLRDRWQLLMELLKKLPPMLESASVCTFIVIVEQTDAHAFNKGLLMNAAVIESSKRVPFDCIIFHDVDLVPVLGDDVYYNCPAYPRHLSVKIDKFNYTLPYLNLIGGILAMPVNHFLRVNGFSNLFWGWGAEDDDMFERLSILGIPITRPMPRPTRYVMLPHKSSKILDTWRKNLLLKIALKRYRLDGLNTAKYRVITTNVTSVCDLLGNDRSTCLWRSLNLFHFLIHPVPISGSNVLQIFHKH
uniref:Beta-1,4-galactosyltransferase n=2 Tax=Mesocestoides corti TaxID=53468 RepID=A0A5K3EVX5_MESCO